MAVADRTSPVLAEGNLLRLVCALGILGGHSWGSAYLKPGAGAPRWTRQCRRCGRVERA